MEEGTLLELIRKLNKESITLFFFFRDVNMNSSLVNNNDIIVQTCQRLFVKRSTGKNPPRQL